MIIHFTKASGAGNDFVIIDNRDARVPADHAALARSLCDRHFGVGADGLLLLERSSIADFAMKYYNADGSYGGMCGNGGRCLARFAYLKGIAGVRQTFTALDFTYSAEIKGTDVALSMKDPARTVTGLEVPVPGLEPESMHFIDTGSPHVVVFVKGLGKVDVAQAGKFLRYHDRFAPEGANVNFVEILDANTISVRTFERGVETETLACGTGSVASAVLSHLVYATERPVRVCVRSGEDLLVGFSIAGEGVSGVVLQGSAHMIFDGMLEHPAHHRTP